MVHTFPENIIIKRSSKLHEGSIPFFLIGDCSYDSCIGQFPFTILSDVDDTLTLFWCKGFSAEHGINLISFFYISVFCHANI